MTIRQPTRFDRFVFVLRRSGVPSAVTAAAIVGFAAGIVSAAEITLGLLVYTLGWLVLTVAILIVRDRRTRLAALRRFLRRSRRGGVEPAPYHVEDAEGGVEPASEREARLLALTSTPDSFYVGTFRTLLASDHPSLIITPCNPRDVGRPELLLHEIVAAQWTGQPLTVKLGSGTQEFQLIRQLPRANDTNHAFASRDVCYIADMAHELRLTGSGHRPLVRPEHTVDLDQLATHNLVVVSGPDTNFWHAALYEAVARGFDNPPSTVPLALGLRDMTAKGVPIYGSADLFVRLRGAEGATGIRADIDGQVRLPEQCPADVRGGGGHHQPGVAAGRPAVVRVHRRFPVDRDDGGEPVLRVAGAGAAGGPGGGLVEPGAGARRPRVVRAGGRDAPAGGTGGGGGRAGRAPGRTGHPTRPARPELPRLVRGGERRGVGQPR